MTPTDRRNTEDLSVEDLSVEDLSVEDKAALVCGADFWSTQAVEHADIKSIVLTDGPHGVRRQAGDPDHLGLHDSLPATCFPPAVAVGCSWNPAVAEALGAALGREARALGVHVALGPGVNIKRSPLCGRNFEYYSEDPLLAGVLAAAHVRGQQAQGVGASVKHFAANNQETERMRISADVDERTLREIYFPAFERVVTDADPATVMCSYNRINGVFSSQNRWLLTEVLREQWGFGGAVVSDWGAVSDPVAAVEAGLDLQMPGTGGRSAQQLVDAVRAGDLDERALDAAAHRVVALTERVDVSPVDAHATDLDAASHHELARRLAAECAVLLKNDRGTLPLRSGARIAVIGDLARTPRFQAGGSSHIAATRVDIPLDAMRSVGAEHGCEVDCARGYALEAGEAGESSAALRDAAVALARSADVAVVFAGLAESDESEGFDRTHLDLPAAQIEVIRSVAAAAPRTVVVLANGGVVSLEGWHDDVDAILEGFLLGQAGGGAVADLLFGLANPSGRLAETIPRRLADTASYVNFPGEQGHVRYGEGVMVGYRWHRSVGVPERYPFGHGLSYTEFEHSALTVQVTADDAVHLEVTVRNVGDRRGAHVVQVYVGADTGPVRRPVRELRSFTKIELDPGESCRVTADLGRRAFAFWDIERHDWVVAAGRYRIEVCRDAATVLAAGTAELAGDPVVIELTLDSTVEQWFTHPVVGADFLAAVSAHAPADAASGAGPELLRMVGSMPLRSMLTMAGIEPPDDDLQALMERSRGSAAEAG